MTNPMILVFSDTYSTDVSCENANCLAMKLFYAGVLGKEAPPHEKR